MISIIMEDCEVRDFATSTHSEFDAGLLVIRLSVAVKPENVHKVGSRSPGSGGSVTLRVPQEIASRLYATARAATLARGGS